MKKGRKKEQILEYLRQEIHSGHWPEKRLPREVDLAKELEVARGTLRKALSDLESEGLVVRKKHSGTMINSGNPKPVIGVIMRCHGDFYEEIYQHLQRELVKAGFIGQFIDTACNKAPKMKSQLRKEISGILNSGIRGLITDGFSFYSLPRHEEILQHHPVFFDYYDGIPIDPKHVVGVLIDYYQIGRTGAEYLLKKGCRRPLFFCGPLKPRLRYSPKAFSVHKYKRMVDGISEVLAAAGMDPWTHICMADMEWKYLDRILFEIFACPGSRPDGIFACEDVKVVKLLKIAAECCCVPRHKIGVGNTPWSRGRSGFCFSSIGQSPNQCSKSLIRQLQLPWEQRSNIYVEPELFDRDGN